MNVFHKSGVVFLVVMLAYLGGYFQGRQRGREATLKAAVEAYQAREKINAEVQNMDSVSLCRALGGLSDECTGLMRGVDAPAGNK